MITEALQIIFFLRSLHSPVHGSHLNTFLFQAGFSSDLLDLCLDFILTVETDSSCVTYLKHCLIIELSIQFDI